MLLASTLKNNYKLRNFFNKAIGIINFTKHFLSFYKRYYDLISKFQVGLKSFLRQRLLEPELYSDLVHKLMKIVSSNNFSTVH